MTEKIVLPEGVTYNQDNNNPIELELSEETINNTKCNVCEFQLEAILLKNESRHSGEIRLKNNNVIWSNSLPKDRTRSIKILNETLINKINHHKEGHKND